MLSNYFHDFDKVDESMKMREGGISNNVAERGKARFYICIT